MATKQTNAENADMLAYALTRLRPAAFISLYTDHPVFPNELECAIEMGRKWPTIKPERIAHQICNAERKIYTFLRAEDKG